MTTTLTPQQFVATWSKIQQNERAIAQSHFIDVCRLIGHPTPIEYDPTGEQFSFETSTVKVDGQKGFADVFFRGRFIWEYKGPNHDLDKAYQQLLLYRDALHNPPLLITSDIHTIHIHTNFNNRPTQKHTITFDDILHGRGVEYLTWAFTDPNRFMPEHTKEEVTRATAETFIAVADTMKKHQRLTGEDYTPEQLAHFLVRLLFCLFAEDLGLLPENVFTNIVRVQGGPGYADLGNVLRNLFRAMHSGESFWIYRIPRFDGTLFDDEFVPSIPHDLSRTILRAAKQDWSAVDPSIFGTLFERVIDEDKRAQLGAHYTSQDDILLIVEPVLMEPLRRRWDEVRRQVNTLLGMGGADETKRIEAHQLLSDFAAEIASMRVLDPACGSGNFLYVALRHLLALQKEVITYAGRRDLPPIELTVSPQQLYGIEINPYAHELAQVTAWIGYLQWRHENGFAEMDEPILRPLNNIRNMDAILAYDQNGRPVEPQWPAADVIIGNPPFLGSYKIRSELGDNYTENLYALYEGRIPGAADLVCYWFEKARNQVQTGVSQRVGLIATNSIRGGANRKVLERIKTSGDIFLAWSDNPWILEGAAVRVSIIGFDNGTEQIKVLDGKVVLNIHADLTSKVDITSAKPLAENKGICFRSDEQGGPFDIEAGLAQEMLRAVNISGLPNSDVVRPYINAADITGRPSNKWIIDFGVDVSLDYAMKYEMPFDYVNRVVRPVREQARAKKQREAWWLHRRPGPDMRRAVSSLRRFIVTPAVAKHRLFVWLDKDIIPSHANYTIARDDDYFFGVLHSRLHELWALRMGTWLGVGNDPRYTPTTTFETFPFPWPPGQEPAEADDPRVAAIAHWARQLVAWRNAWLNPPPPPSNVIDVTYERQLKVRTLTNLYNGLVYYRETIKQGKFFDAAEFSRVTRNSVSRHEIIELDDIHTELDAAVLDAYGWPPSMTDDEILEQLLSLNLQRSNAIESQERAAAA